MAWNKTLEAAANDKGAVRVAVQVTSKGKSRLIFMLSDDVMEQLGSPDCANAWLGDGKDQGKILIQCDAEGALPIKAYSRGGANLRVLLPVDLTQEKRKALVCQHEIMDGEGDIKQLLIVLPPALLRTKLASAA